MFNRVIDYQAAYIGRFPTFAEDMGPAFRWALERAGELGCRMTVVAPKRDSFSDIPLLSDLPPFIGQETPQTLKKIGHRVEPVVVACWPTAQHLEQIETVTGLKALGVVPWDEDEIDTWRSARGAVDLLGKLPASTAPSISDPVVEAAMKSLTDRVNLSTGLSHPSDRSSAIQAFKILKGNDHPFDPREIRAWAMANGWEAEDARNLSDYAERVLSGKKCRTDHPMWKSDIIEIWQDQADRT